MTTKAGSLIDRRARAWAGYQEVLERARTAEDLSAEDRQALDAAEADIAQLSEDIERFQRAEAIEARFSAVDRSNVPSGAGDAGQRSNDEAYGDAFWSAMRRGIGSVGAEARQLLEGGFVPGDDLRAQGLADDTAGGYLVPEVFRNVLTETMKFYGGMLEVANIITTTTGGDLVWPTNDDTGNEGEYLTEGSDVSEQGTTFGRRKLGAFVLSTKMIKVYLPLLTDSAFALDSWLPKKMGERIGRRGNRAFTVGTGVGQPEGFVNAVAIGKTGAGGQTTTVIYDDLIDLEHSVDVAYRNQRSRWMFHDLTLAALRKMKDLEGRPLWEPSLKLGAPDVFNGRPYTVNNDMPVMAASARSIAFGDFEAGYVIRRVAGVTMMRLDERYAEKLQRAFLGFERHDGMVDDAAAIRVYAHPAS